MKAKELTIASLVYEVLNNGDMNGQTIWQIQRLKENKVELYIEDGKFEVDMDCEEFEHECSCYVFDLEKAKEYAGDNVRKEIKRHERSINDLRKQLKGIEDYVEV